MAVNGSCNILTGIIVFVLFISTESIGVDKSFPADNFTYSKCSSNLLVLEKALYEIDGNKLNLTNTFYPPRKISTAFVKVIYKFQNESGYDDHNCTATYWWASGTFLLVQSPAIFRFSSLLFGNKVDNLNNLTLTLPYECRPVVQNTKTTTCSCKSKDNKRLDVLTQQLKLYAKYNEPLAVVRDDSTTALAVCDEELEDDYYIFYNSSLKNERGILLFFIFTIAAPIFFLCLNLAMIRSCNDVIYNNLKKNINHPDLTALVIGSIVVTIYITILDVASMSSAVSGKDKIGSTNNHHTKFSFNAIISYILVFFDCIIVICQFVALSYLASHTPSQPDEVRCLYCFKTFFSIFFSCIFERSQEFLWERRKEGGQMFLISNGRYIFVLVFCIWMLSFLLAGHFLFVLMSWLIDPAEATSVALICVGTLAFFFVITRQCYVSYSKKNCERFEEISCSCFIMAYPCQSCCEEKCGPNNGNPAENRTGDSSKQRNIDSNDRSNRKSTTPRTANSTELHECTSDEDPLINATTSQANMKYTLDGNAVFNSKAFWATFGWAVILTAAIGLTMWVFFELPLSVLSLPNYLLNVVQILLVVVSILIAYKLFFSEPPGLTSFLRHFRASYRKMNEKNKKKNESSPGTESSENVEGNHVSSDQEKIMENKFEDVEALGELAGVVIHSFRTYLDKKTPSASGERHHINL